MNRTLSQLIRAQLAKAGVDDTGPQQLVKVTGLSGQVIGEAVRSQHFGMSSNPPDGAEALVLAMGAGLDRAHVLGLEHPGYRPTNTPRGGTKLYDANGDTILLSSGIAHNSSHDITITSATKVTIKAPTVVIDGNVTLGGPDGSGVPAAKRGTIDTGGFSDITNLATKVNVQ